MPQKEYCKECDHPRSVHSREGCLNNGRCEYGCMVKYMDKNKFETRSQ